VLIAIVAIEVVVAHSGNDIRLATIMMAHTCQVSGPNPICAKIAPMTADDKMLSISLSLFIFNSPVNGSGYPDLGE
jgi:hypothetical protein